MAGLPSPCPISGPSVAIPDSLGLPLGGVNAEVGAASRCTHPSKRLEAEYELSGRCQLGVVSADN